MRVSIPFILLLLVILPGCTSADFKAVEALRVGMTKQEARSTIEAYGFTSKEREITRPQTGWPDDRQTFLSPQWRAALAEKSHGTRIEAAETYPVQHGLLGYGVIYLFYDTDGKLASFYRLQIN